MIETTTPLAGATGPRLGCPEPHANWALFMDVDGTLVEVAPTPDQVVVATEMVAAVERAHATLRGAVAVVSGRPVAEIDQLLAPLHLPAAGLHGLEQRLNGAVTVSAAAGDPATNRAALAELAAACVAFAAQHAGLTVEDKGLTVALHYRAAPDLANAARSFVEQQVAAHMDSLHCVNGKMVLEVKPRGASKGSAVEAFMAKPPFAGRIPVFVGDDSTDEDGFAAANRGAGVSIRVGPTPPHMAASQAQWQCAGVPEFVAWLGTLSDRLARS